MMEKTHSRECHNHTVSVAGFDYEVVTDRAAGLCYIGYAAALCSFDVIAKGEECVRANRNTGNRIKILSCFLFGKGLGTGGKVLLPISLCANVFLVLVYISVYNVISVGTGDCGKERKVKHLFVLTKMPGICLCSCKACAMNSRLLTCSDTDSLSLICVAYGI